MHGLKLFLKRKKMIWLICYPAAFFCLAAAKHSPYIAEEIFAKGIYKFLSLVISAVTRWFPFSLAELLLIILPVLIAVFAVVFIIKVIKDKNHRRFRFFDGILNIMIAAGVMFLLYELGCGINYHRYSISAYMDFTVADSTKEELYGLCVSLAEKTNAARAVLGSASEDAQGVFQSDVSRKKLGGMARDAFSDLAEEYPVFSGTYPEPKPIFFSGVLSKMGITGIFIPFTMEANVNIDIPDYSIAYTMCHELAHLHGFMREDEANYISYLVCTSSAYDELVYSGFMEALIVAGNALYKKDAELYYSVRTLYSEAVERDLAANSLYWLQFEGNQLNQAAERLNHAYLKANDQKDGIESYGRMVDLLLAEYRNRR